MHDLLEQQKNTYETVYLRKPKYDTPMFHYDWWMFPLPLGSDIASSSTSRRYAVTPEQTVTLLENSSFLARYLHSLKLYLTAQLHGWNRYVIRFEKVVWSIVHFISHCESPPVLAELWKCAFVALSVIEDNKLLQERYTRCDSFNMFVSFMQKEIPKYFEGVDPSILTTSFSSASEFHLDFSQEPYSCRIFELSAWFSMVGNFLKYAPDRTELGKSLATIAAEIRDPAFSSHILTKIQWAIDQLPQ